MKCRPVSSTSPAAFLKAQSRTYRPSARKRVKLLDPSRAAATDEISPRRKRGHEYLRLRVGVIMVAPRSSYHVKACILGTRFPGKYPEKPTAKTTLGLCLGYLVQPRPGTVPRWMSMKPQSLGSRIRQWIKEPLKGEWYTGQGEGRGNLKPQSFRSVIL